jgi:ElaB/YqjD/DUF883 family membrane-anchored ribosome-binding protein
MDDNSWSRWTLRGTKEGFSKVKSRLTKTGSFLKEKAPTLDSVKSSLSTSIEAANTAKKQIQSSIQARVNQAKKRFEEWKDPKDPLDKAVRYRRYVLQIPFKVRLGFIAWSAGLICYASTGLRARLRRTSLLTGVLVMICTPELVPWRN